MKTLEPRPAAPADAWWRGAVALGASVRTLQLAHRHRGDRAVAQQAAAWRDLVAQLARTDYGRTHGLHAGMAYSEFRDAVPPRPYESFAPWIERMKAGGPDVLWPGRCAHFAVSSGTTAGRTKYLPVTAAMLAHFRRTGLDTLCCYARRAGNARVFRGRHLFLGGSTALTPLEQRGHQAWAGDLSGISALHLPGWADRHLYEPGREIAQLGDWPAKLRAIAARTAGRNITLLAGIPSWLLVFAEVMRKHTGCATLRDVWPNLECLVHGGVPVGPFEAELERAVGPGVTRHEVYPASEAFIAVQDAEAGVGLRLLTDAGVFYEFLPLSAYDEEKLPGLARAVLPLREVAWGVDYALVLTTPGGLCRYVIGDVVRFTSLQPPRLLYVGRTRLQLSAFGEHVIEKELTDVLTVAAARRGLPVANFHVAPVFVGGEGVRRGRHEWWIELRDGGVNPGDAAWLAAELDRALQGANEDYEAKRRGGGMGEPTVHLVAAGTFECWLKAKGRWGGQGKMPRCRSDRVVADELAALAAEQLTGRVDYGYRG